MSRRDLTLRVLAASVALSAAACGGDDKAAPDNSLEYSQNPDAGKPDWTGSLGPVDISVWNNQPSTPNTISEDVTIPADGVLWEPISIADTRAQRAAFRWQDTVPLDETSTVTFGRHLFVGLEPEEQAKLDSMDLPAIPLPPIRYAQIYVENGHQLRELEEMGIHYSTTPLFDEEWPTGDQSLRISTSGDPDDAGATFVFALIPTPVYNAIRAESLGTEKTYEAVILRDIPASAKGADGNVDWSFLISNLESYAPISTELTDAGEVSLPLDDEATTDAWEAEQKRLGRRIRKALRKVAKAVRGVVDGVRQVVGIAANVFLKSKTIHIKTAVHDRSQAPLLRAWNDGEGGRYNKPLTLKGTRVNVSGRSFLSLYRTQLDENGEAEVKVPKNINVHVCFEADSPSAVIETGVIVPTLHCWNNRNPEHDDDFVGAVGDTEFYALAQLIDARDFATKTLGFTPPKVHVQAGWLGAVQTKGTPAFTPCLAATNGPVAMANAYADALNFGGGLVTGAVLGVPIPVGSVIEFFMTTDIATGDASRHSRNTMVHEYGHFFFCSLLEKTNRESFNLVWSQVLTPKHLDPEASTPVKALNEGFADWFASQATGSVNYFKPDPSQYESGARWANTFLGSGGPADGKGLEMNFGGPDCNVSTSKGCDSLSADYTDGDDVISKVVSILHDSIDRGTCDAADDACKNALRNDASPWNIGMPLFSLDDRETLGHIDDETVELTPRDIKETVEDFARTNIVAGALSYENFYGALVGKMKQRNESDLEICQLFALHETDGVCDFGLPGTTPVPHTPGAPVSTTPVPPTPVPPTPVPPAPVTIYIVPVTGGSVSFGGAAPAGPCSAASCVYTPGSTAVLTAVTQPGYKFTRWSACSSSTAPVLQLTVSTQDQTCIANFVADAPVTPPPPPPPPPPASYTVSATPTAGGSVTPASSTVSSGGSVTLVATASPGYRFTGYTGSAQCSGSAPSLLIASVTADVACTANFVRVLRVGYSVDVPAYAHYYNFTGTGCGGGACIVDAGGSIRLNVSVNDGAAHILKWTCTESGTGAVITSEAPDESLTLSNVQNDWACVGESFLMIL